MKNRIIAALKEYRKFVALSCILSLQLKLHDDKNTRERLEDVESQKAIIECWFNLLTDDEMYVVKRHLIDGISWARLHIEHERIWGEEYAKSERMLKFHQADALEKIVAFSVAHTEPCNKLLLHYMNGGQSKNE